MYLASFPLEMVDFGSWQGRSQLAPDGEAVGATAMRSPATPRTDRRRKRRQGPKDAVSKWKLEEGPDKRYHRLRQHPDPHQDARQTRQG